METQAVSVGSAVFKAVLARAKSERSRYLNEARYAEQQARQAEAARDEASAARERYEQCVSFLDASTPEWRGTLSSSDHMELFGPQQLVQTADPELEKLIAEEEEIERQARDSGRVE